MSKYFYPGKKKIFITIFLLFSEVSAAAPLTPQQAWQRFNQNYQNRWKIKWDKKLELPRKIYGYNSESFSGEPLEIARHFLKENHLLLGIREDLADLSLSSLRETITSFKVRFTQTYQGLKVEGSEVIVLINRLNQVEMLNLRYYPNISLETTPSLSPDQALEIILASFPPKEGKKGKKLSEELVIYPKDKEYYLAYRIIFSFVDPPAKWSFFIASEGGKILSRNNLLRFSVKGKGKVFYPNPVVSAQDDPDFLDLLSDQAILTKDSDAEKLNKQMREVALPELNDPRDGLYALSGRYVDTGLTSNRAKEVNPVFNYTRADDRFEEVMTYYYLHQAQNFIKNLGFEDLVDSLSPLKVNVRGPGGNSYYDLDTKTITFGQGGERIDEAEDAEIIIHEYGHALQDAQVPDLGRSSGEEPKRETLALAEGFSDYLAVIFLSEISAGFQDECFADWSAYTDPQYQNPPCLTRLDTDKHYPEDLKNEEHQDGEIWSAALYKIHQKIGREETAKIVIQSHSYLSNDANFQEGAEAVLKAEEGIYGGEYKNIIASVFQERGIPILFDPPGNIDFQTIPATRKRVDGYDLAFLQAARRSKSGEANWNPSADLDGNRLINEDDLKILKANFGKTATF